MWYLIFNVLMWYIIFTVHIWYIIFTFLCLGRWCGVQSWAQTIRSYIYVYTYYIILYLFWLGGWSAKMSFILNIHDIIFTFFWLGGWSAELSGRVSAAERSCVSLLPLVFLPLLSSCCSSKPWSSKRERQKETEHAREREKRAGQKHPCSKFLCAKLYRMWATNNSEIIQGI